MQVTPLMVNGVLYAQAGMRRAVVAIDPTTGELLWMWRMDEGKRGEIAPRQGSGRGVAYWTDGKGDERIVTITPGYHMVALNAKTGIPVASFGRNGIVDLKTELDQPTIDLTTADIGINAPPAIGNNVIVVGAAHTPGGAPRAKENVKGYVRGYDVRTGKRLWIFHTIPQPGEFGNNTWENDSWSYTGNAGNWGAITIDEATNRVYLATEMATGDYYGGHRPGANLFTDCIVSLDLNTGKRYWYFQAIHHDIWDWDFPAPAILMDINVGGKPIKAVAVPSKQGWLYTFDRISGEPVWPIVERPVEKGNVPGEWYSPTQPFPDQAGPVRSARRVRGRSERLDAGDQSRSAPHREPSQDWTNLHAAYHDGRRRQSGSPDAAGCDRRRELGRWCIRSGDRHRLHLLHHQSDTTLPGERSVAIEHELYPGRRRRR